MTHNVSGSAAVMSFDGKKAKFVLNPRVADERYFNSPCFTLKRSTSNYSPGKLSFLNINQTECGEHIYSIYVFRTQTNVDSLNASFCWGNEARRLTSAFQI